jgi:hypothetical protein
MLSLRIVGVLAALTGVLAVVQASDLPVTYNVQDRPLRAAISGTPLTFTLYSDAACTQRVYQATIPVQNVTLISRLKLATPKGAPKAPPTDQIEATLLAVQLSAQSYLTVTGTGVTASGNACQAQLASKTSALGPVLKDANGQLIGTYIGLNGSEAVLRTVAGQLLMLDVTPTYYALPFGSINSPVWFTQPGCTGQAMVVPPYSKVQVEYVYGTTGYYPSGPYASMAYASMGWVGINGNVCQLGSGTEILAPTATEDLSGFVAPFHVEMQ